MIGTSTRWIRNDKLVSPGGGTIVAPLLRHRKIACCNPPAAMVTMIGLAPEYTPTRNPCAAKIRTASAIVAPIATTGPWGRSARVVEAQIRR